MDCVKSAFPAIMSVMLFSFAFLLCLKQAVFTGDLRIVVCSNFTWNVSWLVNIDDNNIVAK